MPDYLTDYGKKYYQLLIKQLGQITLINDLDKPSLVNLAVILGVLEDSHRQIKEKGTIVQTSYGPKPNPAIKIIKDYTTSYMNLAKSLSLTPEMRHHLQKVTEENTSQFATEDNMDFINNLLEGIGDE